MARIAVKKKTSPTKSSNGGGKVIKFPVKNKRAVKIIKPPTTKDREIKSSLSKFQVEYKKLRRLIGAEAKDFSTDKAANAILRAMLSTTIRMLPLAEASYRKYSNERAAYAYSALVSQIRELMADLRAVQSLDAQAETINTKIMQNAIRLLIQNLSLELYSTKAQFDSALKTPKDKQMAKRAVDVMVQQHGAYMKEVYEKICADVTKLLVGA